MKKKSINLQDNIDCELMYEKANNEFKNPCDYLVKGAVRLRTCEATVTETKNFYILSSYRTNIACIDKKTHILYDYLRFVYGYTATSERHISKFAHDYKALSIKRWYRY